MALSGASSGKKWQWRFDTAVWLAGATVGARVGAVGGRKPPFRFGIWTVFSLKKHFFTGSSGVGDFGSELPGGIPSVREGARRLPGGIRSVGDGSLELQTGVSDVEDGRRQLPGAIPDVGNLIQELRSISPGTGNGSPNLLGGFREVRTAGRSLPWRIPGVWNGNGEFMEKGPAVLNNPGYLPVIVFNQQSCSQNFPLNQEHTTN